MTSGAGAAAGDRDRALRGVRAAASARNGVKREMAAPSSSGVGQPLAAPGVQRPIEKPRRVGKVSPDRFFAAKTTETTTKTF